MPSGLGPMRRETANLRQWAKSKSSQNLEFNKHSEVTSRKLPITLEYRVVKRKDGSRQVLYCFSDDRNIGESSSVRAEFDDLFDLAEALTAVLEGLSS